MSGRSDHSICSKPQHIWSPFSGLLESHVPPPHDSHPLTPTAGYRGALQQFLERNRSFRTIKAGAAAPRIKRTRFFVVSKHCLATQTTRICGLTQYGIVIMYMAKMFSPVRSSLISCKGARFQLIYNWNKPHNNVLQETTGHRDCWSRRMSKGKAVKRREKKSTWILTINKIFVPRSSSSTNSLFTPPLLFTRVLPGLRITFIKRLLPIT